MAFVIVDSCTKDEECVQVCPVDCIHPRKDEEKFAEAKQLYVDPINCIDCGACVPVCPASAIYAEADLPADKADYLASNAAYYQ